MKCKASRLAALCAKAGCEINLKMYASHDGGPRNLPVKAEFILC